MSSLLLKALRCENEGRPPVWLMRQAGRSLPAYRKLRETYSLSALFHEPELAAAVTRLPVDILGVDAAILFSDILVIGEAFGINVRFPEKGGPFAEPILTPENNCVDVEEKLDYVTQTIRLLKRELTVPLIGFCG